ncbi:ABC transporter substrate-binding protein [Diaphorobacter sp. HDW4B]|uniref:ABC transporter substrate-binding protein n=1 Tax=Diaphorobacter sp. HDW4B TaxID=2714925 RepID=UPI00140AEBD2|nr:ABC transporter substrate-binding protein [Diaphorobacter sp. HDW4B]QIL71485.1 ABC transporter substrate-binding protein [Diaphorobacter sp. HDW4B]
MIHSKRRHAMAAMAAGLLFSSLPSIAQAQSQPILIGQTVGVTGSAAATVKESMQGAELYFNHVNAQGGIAGKKIEVVTLDDKFDPKLTLDNARTLIEEKHVTALFMPRGTPHTQDLIPLLDRYGVPLVGPSTGAMTLHQPVPKNIFHVRATYQREVEMAIDHMVSQGQSRFAVLHVDDTFGQDGLAGAQKGFATHKLEPTAIETFNRSKPDFSASAPRILASKAQVTFVIGTGSAVVDGIVALRNAGYGGQIITLSNNASGGFVKALGDKARGIIVTQVFPSERSMAYPLIQELQRVAKSQGVTDTSPAMVEGFASAKVLVEGLRRAAPNIDRARLHGALESMSKYDIGGLELSYGPSDHTGMNFADLSIIGTDGKFRR